MALSKRMWEKQQERKKRERERRARRRRNCLLVVLLVIAAVILIVCFKGCNSEENKQDIPQKEQITHSPENKEEISTIPIAAQTEVLVEEKDFFNNAVFLGNAFIEGMDVYGLLDVADFYSGVNITLENVYTTSSKNSTTAIVDQLKSKKFSKVFLAFGEHELSWESHGRFSKLYGELVEEVREYQPSANVFVFSIPPAGEKVYSSDSYGINLQNIKTYNRALKKLAMNEKLYYIDCFKALGGAGDVLDDNVSADGINLDKNSYAKILNFASDRARVPSATDIANDENESEVTEEPQPEEESKEKTPTELAIERENTSGKNKATEETPRPTVNVLKDSAVE